MDASRSIVDVFNFYVSNYVRWFSLGDSWRWSFAYILCFNVSKLSQVIRFDGFLLALVTAASIRVARSFSCLRLILQSAANGGIVVCRVCGRCFPTLIIVCYVHKHTEVCTITRWNGNAFRCSPLPWGWLWVDRGSQQYVQIPAIFPFDVQLQYSCDR